MASNRLKLLAIETSGKICSVALCSFDNTNSCPVTALENNDLLTISATINFEIIAEYSIYIGNKHDKFCAELCYRMLQDNDMALCDLSGVAVSIGPGSFTGLRIGLAVAKGLCFDNSETGPQLIAVSTLNAIALNGVTWLSHDSLRQPTQKSHEQILSSPFTTESNNTYSSGHTCLLAIIHSHSNLYYHQLFDIAGMPASDIGFSDIASIKAQFADKSVYIGTNNKLDVDFGFYSPPLSSLTALAIGRLGAIQFVRRQFANVADIQPLYVQAFVPR